MGQPACKHLCVFEFVYFARPDSVIDGTAVSAGAAAGRRRSLNLGSLCLGSATAVRLLAQALGGQVTPAQEDSAREYGKTVTWYDRSSPIFQGLPEKKRLLDEPWGLYGVCPCGFSADGTLRGLRPCGHWDEARRFYGVQFHPEVSHTEYGTQMIRNFLYEVCGAHGTWSMADYKGTAIRQIRDRVGRGRVLLALSGGVDSSVCAALLAEAIGSQLTCVFVDHGLMRLNEGDEIEAAFARRSMNFVRVNAERRFLSKLSGQSDPECKRKIIGEEFIRVFEEEARKLGAVDYLAQGTITTMWAACPTMWSSRRSWNR